MYLETGTTSMVCQPTTLEQESNPTNPLRP